MGIKAWPLFSIFIKVKSWFGTYLFCDTIWYGSLLNCKNKGSNLLYIKLPNPYSRIIPLVQVIWFSVSSKYFLLSRNDTLRNNLYTLLSTWVLATYKLLQIFVIDPELLVAGLELAYVDHFGGACLPKSTWRLLLLVLGCLNTLVACSGEWSCVVERDWGLAEFNFVLERSIMPLLLLLGTHSISCRVQRQVVRRVVSLSTVTSTMALWADRSQETVFSFLVNTNIMEVRSPDWALTELYTERTIISAVKHDLFKLIFVQVLRHQAAWTPVSSFVALVIPLKLLIIQGFTRRRLVFLLIEILLSARKLRMAFCQTSRSQALTCCLSVNIVRAAATCVANAANSQTRWSHWLRE